ncbi:hypothetical protein A0130_02675 [Leifsonia xyli]|nr:hypothetical protein A0130_02675 [Leifsonia xyli]
MGRRTLAERIQDGFESRPLTEHHPMSPARPVTPARRRQAKFYFIASGVVFAMVAFVLAFLAVDGVWWNVQSQAVCTITSAQHHPVYSKSGFLGTDWNIGTAQCGDLQVTRNGERFPDAAAQHVARSLHVGETYRLYLRGWNGWPEPAKAIIGATHL